MHEHGRGRVSQTRVVPLRLAKRFASPGVVLLLSAVHVYGLSCPCDLTCLTIALVCGHNVRVPVLVLVTFCLLPPSPPFSLGYHGKSSRLSSHEVGFVV